MLGIKAVIAESFERIHRANLVGMGILPLELPAGQLLSSLGLRGDEIFSVHCALTVRGGGSVTARREGETRIFPVVIRIDTDQELAYVRNGGILPYVVGEALNGHGRSG